MNPRQVNWLWILTFLFWFPMLADAQTDEPGESEAAQTMSLTELLQSVKREASEASVRNAERLQKFSQDRDQRLEMLKNLEGELAQAERRSQTLGTRFDENEKAIQELQERLTIRIGNFGELFGVVRQVAGDAKGVLDASLISAQKPDRGGQAGEIAQSRELPGISELRSLQLLLLEEMIDSAGVVRFDTQFTDASGVKTQGELVRVGSFNLVHGNQFIEFQPETGDLQVLPRQPAGRFRDLAEGVYEAEQGTVPMAVDPTRGQLLGLFIQTPSLIERIQQGSYVGYTIIAMGLAGLAVALWRLVVLHRVRRAVLKQLRSPEADDGNPLGRILKLYQESKDKTLDALSLTLDEAIMRETPTLERYQGIIKVFAALAPLLGLLGTVVGMILTFQQLTLFGTGDPKLMAGGISQALMTTVLGLVVAIPLILLHSLVSSTSRTLVEILEEQSVGLVARRADQG